MEKNLIKILLRKSFCIYFVVILALPACLEFEQPYSGLPPGPWRAVLKLDPERKSFEELQKETRARDKIVFEDIVESDLPFNFEVIYEGNDSFYIEIRNASERIRLDEIIYKKDAATNKDTLIIPFPPYDSYFRLIFEDNILEGYWVVPSRGNYEVHVVARHGQNHRFTTLKNQPIMDLTGRWDITFGLDDSIPEMAIGEFIQNGNDLTGTFLLEAGDYRYLEGTVQGNKMYLSCFDGSHMFLFEALINADSTLSGIFRSGIHYQSGFTGKKNPNAQLRNSDAILEHASGILAFEFPDENGQMVSLNDSRFANRPKIIQLMGTWCPNCVDETRFLVDYLERRKPDVDVIALAFERHTDQARARSAISHFRKKLSVSYPILLAGSNNKSEATALFPQLGEVVAFPTLIFLNDRNEIVKTWSGFYGPATSKFEETKAEFSRFIDNLMNSDD